MIIYYSLRNFITKKNIIQDLFIPQSVDGGEVARVDFCFLNSYNAFMPTRREFLQDAFWTAAGAFVAYKGADELGVIDRVYPRTPEAQNLPPSFIDGQVMIVKGDINFRTSPRIPDRNRISHPSNSIKMSDIDQVNGVPLEGKNAFIIKNTPTVIGHDADGERDYGFWIKMDIKKKGEDRSQPYYVSDSYVTRKEVMLLDFQHTYGLEQQSDGSYVDSDGGFIRLRI